MKTTSSILATLTGTCVLLAGNCWAADPDPANNQAGRTDQVFRANELSADIFGTMALGEAVIERISKDRVRDNARFGFGAGVNYFFVRNFGIAADAYTENAGHSFVDDASASLVFRVPLDSIRLAPYVFGGGGYQFDPVQQVFAHAGGGLEYRFKNNMGVFIDARYVFTKKDQDFGLARLGFRFSF